MLGNLRGGNICSEIPLTLFSRLNLTLFDLLVLATPNFILKWFFLIVAFQKFPNHSSLIVLSTPFICKVYIYKTWNKIRRIPHGTFKDLYRLLNSGVNVRTSRGAAARLQKSFFSYLKMVSWHTRQASPSQIYLILQPEECASVIAENIQSNLRS